MKNGMRGAANNACGEIGNLFCNFTAEQDRKLTDGDWPSGKAVDSGSTIGVSTACGSAQGNLLMKTCFQS